MTQAFRYIGGEMVKTGVTFGPALAMAIPFNINHSHFGNWMPIKCTHAPLRVLNRDLYYFNSALQITIYHGRKITGLGYSLCI